MNIWDYVIMIFLELPLGALCGSFMLGNILLSIFFSFNFAKVMESKGYVKNIKKLKKSIWYTIIVQSFLTILLLSVIFLYIFMILLYQRIYIIVNAIRNNILIY